MSTDPLMAPRSIQSAETLNDVYSALQGQISDPPPSRLISKITITYVGTEKFNAEVVGHRLRIVCCCISRQEGVKISLDDLSLDLSFRIRCSRPIDGGTVTVITKEAPPKR